jgi:hypothetical protein
LDSVVELSVKGSLCAFSATEASHHKVIGNGLYALVNPSSSVEDFFCAFSQWAVSKAACKAEASLLEADSRDRFIERDREGAFGRLDAVYGQLKELEKFGPFPRIKDAVAQEFLNTGKEYVGGPIVLQRGVGFDPVPKEHGFVLVDDVVCGNPSAEAEKFLFCPVRDRVGRVDSCAVAMPVGGHVAISSSIL